MIVIPRQQQQQVQAAPVGGGGVSTNAAGLGAMAAVGGGLVALGVGIEQHQQAAKEVAVQNYATRFRVGIGSVLTGTPDQPGYLYTKTGEAVARAPSAAIRIKQIGDDLAAEIEDEDTREAFTLWRNRMEVEAGEKIGAHALEQDFAYRDQSQVESQESLTEKGVQDVLTGVVRYQEDAGGMSDTHGSPVWGLKQLDETLAVKLLTFRAHMGQNAQRYGVDGPEMQARGEKAIRAEFWGAAIKAALTPGPNQDDRLAKALLDKHGAELGDKREKFQEDVSLAHVKGESGRQANAAFLAHVGDEGSWSDRKDAALAEVPAARDTGESKAVQDATGDEIKKLFAQAEAAEEKRYSDDLDQLLDDMDKGLGSTQAAITASGWPVKYRDVVAREIDGRAKVLAGETRDAGDAVYYEWLSKLAGRNPETGEVSQKIQDEAVAHDFKLDRPDMSTEHYNALQSYQDDVRKGNAPNVAELTSDDEIANQVVRTIYPDSKGDERATLLYGVKGQLSALWTAQQADGKKLTIEQKRKEAANLMAETVFDRPGLNTGDYSMLEALTVDPSLLDVDDLDDGVADGIRAQLQASGIADPSDAQIIRAWQLNAQRGLYVR